MRDGVRVVGYEPRIDPGWDGLVHEVIGVATPITAVLSVPPSAAAGLFGVVGTGSLLGQCAP